ncbi:MAG: PqqD family protein [Thermoleophilia bacterium]|nr:PqqD family protein [Thermoleophilia bacterium]
MAEAADGGTGRTLRPHPDVVSREVGEGAVLVHLRTNRIYNLNRTGAAVWRLLEQGRDLDEAEAELLQRFDVEAGELRADVARLVRELSAAGVLDDGSR